MLTLGLGLKLTSHGIHEIALGTSEDEDGEEESDTHKEGAVEETVPIERATTQAAIFERLKDGRKGVEGYDVTVFFRSCGKGVDNWSGIHEELDAKLDKELHVTVFGGHRGDNQSPRHTVHGYQEY